MTTIPDVPMMSLDDFLLGLRQIAELLPAPTGPFIAVLATLGQEAMSLAQSTPGADELAVLHMLREAIRSGLTAELQAAIDADDAD